MMINEAPTMKPLRAPTSISLFDLPAFRRDPLRVLMDAWRKDGDVVRIAFGPVTMYLVAHPDGVEHVLVGNHRNYDKRAVGYEKLRLALGDGLLTSEGDFWRRQRRIMQPAFHRDRLRHFGAVMTSCTASLLSRWREVIARGEAIDVDAAMMSLTLEIIGKTMFSTDLSGQAALLGEFMTVAIRFINDRMLSPMTIFDFPEKLPTANNRRFREVIRAGDELVLALIAERRAGSEPRNDLLAMLMDIRDEESGEGMTDRQLRDEIITIFGAGHETTANALTWLWYLLAQHPEAAARLRAELDEVLGGRLPTVDDLPKLVVTARVVKEAMRLFPPAWILNRRALGDDVIGGYRIPKGSAVILSPFVTHRHPDFWPNAEAFDPDRFRDAPPHKYAYFPFGGGPRLCIGSGFAQMEAQLITATIAQACRFALEPGHEIAMEPLVTLRARGMRMVPRAR